MRWIDLVPGDVLLYAGIDGAADRATFAVVYAVDNISLGSRGVSVYCVPVGGASFNTFITWSSGLSGDIGVSGWELLPVHR